MHVVQITNAIAVIVTSNQKEILQDNHILSYTSFFHSLRRCMSVIVEMGKVVGRSCIIFVSWQKLRKSSPAKIDLRISVIFN